MRHYVLFSEFIVVFTTITCLTVSSSLPVEESDSSDGRELVYTNGKTLQLIKSAIEQMKNGRYPVSKRARCDFNLPGFDCENSLMIHSGADAGWWSAGITPGKRRSCFNADGSSCDTFHYVQELNNRLPWLNGPGKRKRSASQTF
ncbi:hypothetical protein CHUAL_010872 [Chamberlinius hualienensis]